MAELNFTEIFTGISPYEVDKKDAVMLLECHNLEPTRNKDYKLHEILIDLNADGYDWGNP